MDKKPLHLWYAHPEDLTEAVTQACASLLSEDERVQNGGLFGLTDIDANI